MIMATENCPWCGNPISRAKFEEITAEIREQEQKKLLQREAEVRKESEAKYRIQLEQEKKKAIAVEKQAASTKIKELTESVGKLQGQEAELKKKWKLEADKEAKKQLDNQRQVLEESHGKDVLKKQGEFGREREKLLKKVGELERQLQNKTPNDLGDGAEIDLFEILKERFPDDRIKRVRKGEPGADIHEHVIHKGQTCGLIIFDSKNRQAWQRSFATKLHEDQLEANAEHAILSTTVFPSGKKELCIEAGVIVVNPARAVHIVEILRKALVKIHVRGLSMKEKRDKTDQLYCLITSDEYGQQFSEAADLTKQILDLDVEEQKTHGKVWKKRGHLTKELQNVLNEIDSEVSSIIEGPADAGNEIESPLEEDVEAVVGG